MSLTWSLIAPAGMQAVQPPTVPPDDRAAFIASAAASTKPEQKSADWSHLARNWSPLSKAATSCASAWPTSTATAKVAAGGTNRICACLTPTGESPRAGCRATPGSRPGCRTTPAPRHAIAAAVCAGPSACDSARWARRRPGAREAMISWPRPSPKGRGHAWLRRRAQASRLKDQLRRTAGHGAYRSACRATTERISRVEGEMAKPQISRTASATVVVVVATLALLWAIWWLWLQLSPRLDIRTIVAIAIVALVLLAAAWWLWWRLPQRQVARIADQIPAPKDRADVEDNFRKTVGQALGGAAVLRLRHDPRLHWFAGAAQ